MRCVGCGFEQDTSARCERCGAVQSSPPPPNSVSSPASPFDDVERRQITVVFCDLAGSTALSERVDPEDLRDILRDYQRRCADVIRGFRGHVAQYLGDGVMAYFGYPVAEDDSAVYAVEAGLELVRCVAAIGREGNGSPVLRARVGIHSGPVVLGEMGDASSPQRLAVGATPNVAARVQAGADDGSVVITEATYRLVEGYFECDSAGVHRLGGVSQPIRLYRVVSRAPVFSRMDLSKRRGLSPFVGRDQEMALLLGRWRERSQGVRGVVVVGEAGIGKSRLAYEFTRSVTDLELIDCSAAEHHESDALFPLLRYLERWADGCVGGTAGESTVTNLTRRLDDLGLAHCVTDLRLLLSNAANDSVSQGQVASAKQYQRSIEVLAEFFHAIVQRQPSVLLVEDLQWLDPSTRFFLQMWGERNRANAFVLATARPNADLDWLSRAGLEIQQLAPLDASASRTIATQVARRVDANLSDEAVEQLLERAEGVPLFIEESTRAYTETRGGTERGDRTTPISEPPGIPETLRDSLAARLDRLGAARRMAQLAAVIGREFPVTWLRELFGPTSDDFDHQLAQLVDAGLVYGLGDAGATYAFSHALIRDAAYQSLTRNARAKAHRQIAEIIFGHYPEAASRKPLVLAHHFAEGGDVSAAAVHLLRGAKRALASAAFVEAIAIARRGLDLIRRSAEPGAHEAAEIELLTTLGVTLISTRGYSSPEVEEVYSRAAQLCERQGDVPLHVLYGIWAVHLVRSDSRRVTGLAKVLERKLDGASNADEILMVHACLGVRAFYRAKLSEARAHFSAAAGALATGEIVAQHERLISRYGFEGILSGIFWLAWVEALEGNLTAARERLAAAWDLAERIDDPYTTCQVAVYCATLCRELNDAERAEFFQQRALQLSTEHDFAFWRALSLCVQSWLLAEQGNLDHALQQISGGLGVLDALGAVVNRACFQSYLVDVHTQGGRFEAAMHAADEALSMCREGLGPMYEPELLRQKGIALVRSGESQDAEEHLRAALSSARLQGVRLLELRAARDLAVLLRAQGRVAEGTEIFEKTRRAWPDGESSPQLIAARRVVEGTMPTTGGAQETGRG
jgi:class 3 adenylate cyclase/tetratricopeptide (TPR) repeat protein